MTALLSAQQVPRAADFQVTHGDFEPGAEFGKVADGGQTILADFRKNPPGRKGQVGISVPG